MRKVAIRKLIATTSGMEADAERAFVMHHSPSEQPDCAQNFSCVLLNPTTLSDDKIRIRSAISAVWLSPSRRQFGVLAGLDLGWLGK